MWDLETLKKLNDKRVEFLRKKKAENAAIKKMVEDLRSSTKTKGR